MCGKGSNAGGGAGALGWGGLAPAQQQTIQASPEAMGWYRQAMQLGQQAVSRPYQQFGTTAQDFVAQLTPAQQQAIGGLGGLAAATQPYAAMAPQMAAQAGTTSAADLSASYMNPYMQQVVNPVQQALQQKQGQQLAQQQAEAIRGGAFGGERSGIQRQMLRGQQQLGMGQALSPLYQTGYGQALGAAQTDLARQLQAAQGLQGAGTQAQQAALGASTMQQQTAQAGIDALRQQFQQQQMFPYMQAQFLGGLAGGMGPLLGQQTYQARAMTPFGGFFSDGGEVEDDGSRMGGAVVDGGDYYRGGVVPHGYAGGGVSYGGDDLSSILKSQAEMYHKEQAPEQMPTGQIQSAKGLEAPNLTSEEQKRTGLKDITGAAKDILGIGKDIYGMFSGKSDSKDQNQESDSSGFGLGSLVKTGLSFIPGVGGLANLLPFADGGEVPENDGFESAVARTLKFEGGLNPRDTTGMPSMRGISQAAHPGIDVTKLTPEQTKDIYRKEYWEGIGASKLPEGIREMAYDTAVIAGPGKAKQLLAQAEGDPEKFMAARRGFLNSLVERDPEKYGKYAKAWENRNRALEGGLGPVAAELSSERKQFPLGSKERSFMALEPEEKTGLGGLAKEEYVVPALMGLGSALEGMMGAKTVSPGAAIAAGLGSGLKEGAKAYMEVPKIKAETGKIGAETGRIGEETLKTAQETAIKRQEELAKMMDIYKGAFFKVGNLDMVRLADGSTVPLYDWIKNPKQPWTGEAQPTEGEAPKAAAPIVKAPTEEAVRPGIGWDPKSASMASDEYRNISLPGGEEAKKRGELYREKVDAGAQEAQSLKLYNNDVAGVISEAIQATGAGAPGAGASTRAVIVNYINTIARASGHPEMEIGDKIADNTAILSKINTLAGQAGVSSAGQTALGSLARLVEAQPNLDQPPAASSFNAASNMVNNQMNIDRQSHADYYGQKSNQLYSRAEMDFRRLHTPGKYRKEKDVIQRTMVQDPQAFAAMISGKIDPDHIEQYFKDKKHGGLPGMSRYFGD